MLRQRRIWRIMVDRMLKTVGMWGRKIIRATENMYLTLVRKALCRDRLRDLGHDDILLKELDLARHRLQTRDSIIWLSKVDKHMHVLRKSIN